MSIPIHHIKVDSLKSKPWYTRFHWPTNLFSLTTSAITAFIIAVAAIFFSTLSLPLAATRACRVRLCANEWTTYVTASVTIWPPGPLLSAGREYNRTLSVGPKTLYISYWLTSHSNELYFNFLPSSNERWMSSENSRPDNTAVRICRKWTPPSIRQTTPLKESQLADYNITRSTIPPLIEERGEKLNILYRYV